MSLSPLILTIGITLLLGWLARGAARPWSLMVASILAIYWLQPAMPISHLDFWLPTTCLALTVLTWLLTRPSTESGSRGDLMAGAVIAIVVLLIGATRYIVPVCCLTPSLPPTIFQIALAIILIAMISLLVTLFTRSSSGLILAAITLIIGIFVILKFEPLAKWASMILRSVNAQSVELASAIDIRWLGFSYVAFRLIHSLRDRLSGRLPQLTLVAYVIYVIFFPAFTAGPIYRVQHFIQE